MTTPPQGPQGPWGPGQQQSPWGQQGGWQGQPQHGQPPQGQPPQGQPPQGQPPQGQPPQGQPPQQGGWAQQGGQAGWPQQPQQQGGWQDQQSQQGGWPQQPNQWQPAGPGPGGPGGPGGGRNTLPLLIGGGVAGVLLIGLLIFIGIRTFGGDDPSADPSTDPTTGPSSQPTNTDPTNTDPTDQPTNGQPTESGGPGQNEKIGNATGQAKAATDALNTAGFSCTDLFNNPQGAHRGCFKYDASTEAEVIFQFTADGSVIGQRVYVTDSDNLNSAQKTFNDALKGLGGAVFGSDVPNVEAAVRSGKKKAEVATGWGVISLQNDGGRLRMSGRKADGELLEVPKRMFDTRQADLFKGLTAKKYKCTTSCTKRGEGVSIYVYAYASDSAPLSSLTMSVSGDQAKVKPVFQQALGEVFGVVKGPDAQALLGWVKAHMDGKSHSSYVNGWRVTLRDRPDDSYGTMDLKVDYELFYV